MTFLSLFLFKCDLSGLALSRLLAPFPIHVACACLTGIRVTRRKVLNEVISTFWKDTNHNLDRPKAEFHPQLPIL
jgi:hypothetical protein